MVYLRAVCLVRAISDELDDVFDEKSGGCDERVDESGCRDWVGEWMKVCGKRGYLWAGGGVAVDTKAAAFVAGTSVDNLAPEKRQFSVRFF
jgi:hypothetical protein